MTAALVLAAFSMAAVAAESVPVREFYACNLQPGKTMDDVMAIRDALEEVIEEAGDEDLSNRVSFLWTPVKTNGEIDFLWFDMHADMNAMARADAAFEAAGGPDVIGQMAAETVDCGSGIVTHETIAQGSVPFAANGEGPALVQSFVCTLHPGKTLDDARGAVKNWQKVIADLGGYDNYAAYLQTPVISSSSADLYYFEVHQNLQDLARRFTAYGNSKAGQDADRRFNSVHRCNAALWAGEVIIGEPPQ
jgi:NifU-like protein involved in Fe-S cluster formation